MTSYLVTIATDTHQAFVKMCLKDMRTTTEGKNEYKLKRDIFFELLAHFHNRDGDLRENL